MSKCRIDATVQCNILCLPTSYLYIHDMSSEMENVLSFHEIGYLHTSYQQSCVYTVQFYFMSSSNSSSRRYHSIDLNRCTQIIYGTCTCNSTDLLTCYTVGLL